MASLACLSCLSGVRGVRAGPEQGTVPGSSSWAQPRSRRGPPPARAPPGACLHHGRWQSQRRPPRSPDFTRRRLARDSAEGAGGRPVHSAKEARTAQSLRVTPGRCADFLEVVARVWRLGRGSDRLLEAGRPPLGWTGTAKAATSSRLQAVGPLPTVYTCRKTICKARAAPCENSNAPTSCQCRSCPPRVGSTVAGWQPSNPCCSIQALPSSNGPVCNHWTGPQTRQDGQGPRVAPPAGPADASWCQLPSHGQLRCSRGVGPLRLALAHHMGVG